MGALVPLSHYKALRMLRSNSHLYLVFSSPVKVEVSRSERSLDSKRAKLSSSLPMATAGIWVRTDDGVSYFAMFSDHVAVEELAAAVR